MDAVLCKCLQKADYGQESLEAQVFLQAPSCKPPEACGEQPSCVLMCSMHAERHGLWHGHIMRQRLGLSACRSFKV